MLLYYVYTSSYIYFRLPPWHTCHSQYSIIYLLYIGHISISINPKGSSISTSFNIVLIYVKKIYNSLLIIGGLQLLEAKQLQNIHSAELHNMPSLIDQRQYTNTIKCKK